MEIAFLRELLETTEKKKKKDKRDKTADKYFNYIAGNMMMRNTCAGELSGTKKTEKAV